MQRTLILRPGSAHANRPPFQTGNSLAKLVKTTARTITIKMILLGTVAWCITGEIIHAQFPWYNDSTDTISGSTTIVGDLYNNFGTLCIGFHGNSSDQIKVHGTATIVGGVVDVVMHDGLYVAGQNYTFLKANHLTVLGRLKKFAIDYPVFDIDLGYDENTGEYYITLKRKYSYSGFGKTFNQRAVGRYFDIVSKKVYRGSDFWNVIDKFDHLDDNAKLDALDQMSGAIYGTIANNSITNTNLANRTLNDYLRRGEFGNDCGTASACEPNGDACAPACATVFVSGKPRRNLWGLAYGTGGRTQYDGNAYGYCQGFFGTIVGFDKLYGHAIRAGLYASYGEGRISSNLLEKSDSRELLVGLYLRREMQTGYMLLNGGLGYNQYDTERTIAFVNRTATSRHSGFVGTIYGERGVEFQGALAKWQPFVGLQYIGNQQEGFTETGAGSLNLASDITTGSSLRSLLGTRLSTDLARSHRGALALYGQAYWMHEFLDPTYTNFTPRFEGAVDNSKFTVRGNDAARDWAVLGTGLTYNCGNWRLFSGYDISMNSQQVLHTGNAGLACGW